MSKLIKRVKKMMKMNDESGFTLTEMVIAVTIMVIVCVAVVSVSTAAFRSHEASYQTTRGIQEARLAMTQIIQELRLAKSATLSEGGHTLTYQCFNDSFARTLAVSAADNRLYLNNRNDNTNRALTRLQISDFTCNRNALDASKTMDVTITVSGSVNLSSTVQMLNVRN